MSRSNAIRIKLLALLVLLAAVLCACTSEDGVDAEHDMNYGLTDDPEPIIELNGITMGIPPASGLDNFYQQLDALTIRDLGVKIRFDHIPWGDEKNQISRMIVAKEYDIYVGGVWTDFADFASKNAFANLSPYLSEVPNLVEHYRGGLDRVLIDGKLFGIPQLITPGGGGQGMLYREDLRRAWGLPEITNLDTVEQYLYAAKSAYPDTPMINDKRFSDNLWTMIAGDRYLEIVHDYAYASIDDPYTVISMFDTPEYKEVLIKAKQWYDDGIVSRDILAAQDNATSETFELMKADKKPLEFNNHYHAVIGSYVPALSELYPDHEYSWFEYYPKTASSFLPRMSANSLTMISIGAHSKHVLDALKFIEKAHTDQTYYNLLMYGVEGENYHLDEDGYIHYDGIPTENRKIGWTGLSDGYMNPPARYPGKWQEYHSKIAREGAARAEAGGVDPYEGFNFDTSGFTNELTQLETVRAQYVLPLAVGMMDDIEGELQIVKEQLQAAGFDLYLAALQEQLDEFAAAK